MCRVIALNALSADSLPSSLSSSDHLGAPSTLGRILICPTRPCCLHRPIKGVGIPSIVSSIISPLLDAISHPPFGIVWRFRPRTITLNASFPGVDNTHRLPSFRATLDTCTLCLFESVSVRSPSFSRYARICRWKLARGTILLSSRAEGSGRLVPLCSCTTPVFAGKPTRRVHSEYGLDGRGKHSICMRRPGCTGTRSGLRSPRSEDRHGSCSGWIAVRGKRGIVRRSFDNLLVGQQGACLCILPRSMSHSSSYYSGEAVRRVEPRQNSRILKERKFLCSAFAAAPALALSRPFTGSCFSSLAGSLSAPALCGRAQQDAFALFPPWS